MASFLNMDNPPPPVDLLSYLRYPNNPFNKMDDLDERVTHLETFYDDSPARAQYAVNVVNVNVPVLVTIFTGVFSWNPADTTNSGEAVTTLSFPRVTVGDPVHCAFSPSLPPTVLLNGAVTQDGIVQVALINLSGNVLTIAPGQLRVTVLHHQ